MNTRIIEIPVCDKELIKLHSDRYEVELSDKEVELFCEYVTLNWRIDILDPIQVQFCYYDLFDKDVDISNSDLPLPDYNDAYISDSTLEKSLSTMIRHDMQVTIQMELDNFTAYRNQGVYKTFEEYMTDKNRE